MYIILTCKKKNHMERKKVQKYRYQETSLLFIKGAILNFYDFELINDLAECHCVIIYKLTCMKCCKIRNIWRVSNKK